MVIVVDPSLFFIKIPWFAPMPMKVRMLLDTLLDFDREPLLDFFAMEAVCVCLRAFLVFDTFKRSGGDMVYLSSLEVSFSKIS